MATSLGEVSVRVRQSSDPSGGAVLLLHANPGDSRDFDAIVDVLAGQWIRGEPRLAGIRRVDRDRS